MKGQPWLINPKQFVQYSPRQTLKANEINYNSSAATAFPPVRRRHASQDQKN